MVEGRAEILGPDDPAPGLDGPALARLLRDAFLAAGGTHDDWDADHIRPWPTSAASVLVSPRRALHQPCVRPGVPPRPRGPTPGRCSLDRRRYSCGAAVDPGDARRRPPCTRRSALIRSSWLTVARLAEDLACPPASALPVRDEVAGQWSLLAETGFVGLHLPESHGGGVAHSSDVALVIEQPAAALSPAPYVGQAVLVAESACGPGSTGRGARRSPTDRGGSRSRSTSRCGRSAGPGPRWWPGQLARPTRWRAGRRRAVGRGGPRGRAHGSTRSTSHGSCVGSMRRRRCGRWAACLWATRECGSRRSRWRCSRRIWWG